MSKYYYTLSFILLTIYSFADNPSKNKTVKVFYQEVNKKNKLVDGSIQQEFEVLESNDTIKNGFYRAYDRYKKLLISGNYTHNRKIGNWIFYSNGIVESTGNYKDDLEDGKWTFYNGKNLKAEGYYLKGLPIGLWKQYRSNGNVDSEINYNDDSKLNGSCKLYNSKGNLQIQGEFLNGLKNGLWIHYRENGNLICKIMYKNDKKNDTSYTFFNDNIRSKQKIYSNGILLQQTSYYISGKLKSTHNISDTITRVYTNKDYYENGQLNSERVSNDSMLLSIKYFGKKGNPLDNGDYKDGNGSLLSYDDDTLISEATYKNYKLNGGFTTYYHNGKISSIGQFKDDERTGTWYSYSEQGIKLTTINYDAPENTHATLQFDSIINDKIYDRAEIMPSFENGIPDLMKFLSHNIRYPALALENGLEGKVIIKFFVDDLGFINGITVLKDGVGGGCAEEAVRVVNYMPRWNPGYQDGFPVKVYYTLPVTFKLQ